MRSTIITLDLSGGGFDGLFRRRICRRARGSDIVARTCTVCHELDIVTAQRHDADGWRVVANAMIKNGAELTPQEEDQVVEYLAKNLPQ